MSVVDRLRELEEEGPLFTLEEHQAIIRAAVLIAAAYEKESNLSYLLQVPESLANVLQTWGKAELGLDVARSETKEGITLHFSWVSVHDLA